MRCVVQLYKMKTKCSSRLKAFETFINQHEKAPEFISLFIDDNLKKGLRGVSSSIHHRLRAHYSSDPRNQT